ncbi:MAG: hypothetical protein M3220_13060 [Chloroflexota bacterium]|nr:hypothetical protein [Chloroflexota bacterium]
MTRQEDYDSAPGHASESEKMKPEEVEENYPPPNPKRALADDDVDAEMADDIHPDEWEDEWRPADFEDPDYGPNSH